MDEELVLYSAENPNATKFTNPLKYKKTEQNFAENPHKALGDKVLDLGSYQTS